MFQTLTRGTQTLVSCSRVDTGGVILTVVFMTIIDLILAHFPLKAITTYTRERV